MSTRELRREFRDGRGLFNEVIGGVGDLIGAGHRIRGDVGRDRAYGYNSAYRGDVAQDRYRDYRDRRDGDRDDDRRDDRRGDFIRDPRRAGLGSGQRDDARDGQGQGQDPRILATEDYVYALADAAQSPAGSPERAAAMQKAKDILTKPENGLIQSDGSVRFPEGMKVILESNGKQSSYIEFNGIHARATSPEVSIQKGVNAVAGQRIGTALTDADIAALRGTAAPAGATIPVGTGEQPKPDAPQAPAPGAGTGAGGTSPADKSAAPRVLAEPKNGMPQMKMTKDEVIDLQTKLMNTPGFEQEAKAMAARGGADGKPGSATYAAFSKLGSLMNPPLRAEEIDMSNPEIVAKVNAVIEAKRGKSPSVDGQSAPAPAPAADAGQATAPAATDATRLADAVTALVAAAGADRELSAGNITALQQTPELMKTLGQAFDLDRNGTVDPEKELAPILAAAAAKPEAERVTVVGGVAALNPLFAGASFEPVPSTADIASNGNAPAPGLAQTAQVNPQTGEVTPPAAAPASAPLRTENAVYVVPPEPAFEPPPPSVPDVRAPGQRSGGFTIA